MKNKTITIPVLCVTTSLVLAGCSGGGAHISMGQVNASSAESLCTTLFGDGAKQAKDLKLSGTYKLTTTHTDRPDEALSCVYGPGGDTNMVLGVTRPGITSLSSYSRAVLSTKKAGNGGLVFYHDNVEHTPLKPSDVRDKLNDFASRVDA